ncbi:Retrotransposon-derived protein PEG10, partial [Ophiophagus hannah]
MGCKHALQGSDHCFRGSGWHSTQRRNLQQLGRSAPKRGLPGQYGSLTKSGCLAGLTDAKPFGDLGIHARPPYIASCQHLHFNYSRMSLVALDGRQLFLASLKWQEFSGKVTLGPSPSYPVKDLSNYLIPGRVACNVSSCKRQAEFIYQEDQSCWGWIFHSGRQQAVTESIGVLTGSGSVDLVAVEEKREGHSPGMQGGMEKGAMLLTGEERALIPFMGYSWEDCLKGQTAHGKVARSKTCIIFVKAYLGFGVLLIVGAALSFGSFFLISLLSGSAAHWAMPLLTQPNQVLDNYAKFYHQLRAIFEDPVRAHMANRQLRELRQGQGSLTDYIADFRVVTQDLKWNEAALIDQFQEGLLSELLDELVHTECPCTLQELMHLCLRIDARLQQRQAQRQMETASAPIKKAAPLEVPLDEPMQLVAAQPCLTQDKKDRSCRHFVGTCPAKAPKAAMSAAAGNEHRPAYGGLPSLPSLSSPSQSSLVKHLVLTVSVFVPGQGEVEIQALVDSGATANFMDAHFVMQWSIPQQQVLVETIDGQPLHLGPVVSATKPLHMHIGQHVEEAVFYVATVPHFPVFLGRKCVTHCLHACVGAVAIPMDLNLPAELVDFADVFGEKEADQLPLHQSYDCPINLLPDAKLPVGRIYSLSKPELAVLRDFIEKNLCKGFIHPSTFLLDAPVLLIKKKWGGGYALRNWYPLLLIPELIQQLCQAQIFMKLDLHGAYNLVHICAGNEWKTAFQTRYGHFEYTVEHWQYVRLVLQCLRDNHLFAKWEKCQFTQIMVDFLGHCISPASVEMDPEKEQEAFNALKVAFASEPILKHLDLFQPFVVEMDASNVAISAVLLQAYAPTGTLFPCTYYSQRLSALECNYTIWDKELLVVKVAFEPWRHHLELMHYPRSPSIREDKILPWTVIPLEWFAATEEPVDLRVRIQKVQQQDPFVADHWDLLQFRDRIYMPGGPLRGLILRQCHDSPAAGHFGVFKTLHLISRTFWWLRFRHDVSGYVVSCAHPGLLQPLPTPERPWGAVSLDFIIELPPLKGTTTILVVVDMLTKMAHFIACAGLPMARMMAQFFISHVFWLHGLSDQIVLDWGNCRYRRAHHPETDGGTERLNAILEQYLCCFSNTQQDNWVEVLPVAEFTYNNAQYASTHMSLFFTSYVPAVDTFLQELKAMHHMVQDQLERAKEDFADWHRFADWHHCDVLPLGVGDWVWLSTWYLPTPRPSKKLDHRYLGPFLDEAVINPVAFCLSVLLTRPLPPPGLIAPQGEAEYKVDSIRDSCQLRGQFKYLVAWKSYGPEDFIWVDAADVHAPCLVHDFHTRGPCGGDSVMPLLESDSDGTIEQLTGNGSVDPVASEEDPGPSPLHPRACREERRREQHCLQERKGP